VDIADTGYMESNGQDGKDSWKRTRNRDYCALIRDGFDMDLKNAKKKTVVVMRLLDAGSPVCRMDH
jgi:hypothetical protein